VTSGIYDKPHQEVEEVPLPIQVKIVYMIKTEFSFKNQNNQPT
jgi:hypothetical protein